MRAKRAEQMKLNCREGTFYNLMRASGASRKKFKLNCRERGEWKIFGKFCEFCTFPQNSSKLRSHYLFSFQNRTIYLFPAFSRSEYLFSKSARPPSGSDGCPLKSFETER